MLTNTPAPEATAMNRRRFVKLAAAGGILGALTQPRSPTVAARDTPRMPIIDTHQHLWDLQNFRLAWVKDGSVLARTHTLADYKKAAAGLDIVKTIYMEVDVDPSQQQAEADGVVALCKLPESGMVAGVVSGRPASDGFRTYAEQFKGSPYVKGLRQVLHGAKTPPGYCLDPKFVRSIQMLGEFGLRFDVCVRPAELADAGKLIDACPGTQFILDHCGNAKVHGPDGKAPDRTQWRRDLAALTKRPNLVCKVSGLVNSAKKGAWSAADLAPIVNHVLDSFGPDRVIFAGDWPVCTTVATLAEWVSALKEIVRERPAEQQRKLFHDNAVKVYGLS
jgi:predicted TIM-barrel fold metal-dependent hydrolase